MRIEDYALIGNFHSAALVSIDGSIDWLCLPRFDSPACFAALLGDEKNGRWQIQPKRWTSASRQYREGTLVLETTFETRGGLVRLTDCMVPYADYPTLIRLVEGLEGKVKMTMDLVIRFDYGSIVPWVTRSAFGGIKAIAGPDTLRVRTTAPLEGRDLRTCSEFEVRAGDSIPFVMTWTPSHADSPSEVEHPAAEVDRAGAWWQEWIGRCTYEGPYKEPLHRSLITLKALTYQRTGGMVAAPTTSLPENPGGERNWDYRYCWLRDSTFTLHSLLSAGFRDEAKKWAEWLLRAIAGTPSQVNVIYGLRGERRLTEIEIPWLAGYEDSKPVRIGNSAAGQLQLDVFGELIDSFHVGRMTGLHSDDASWRIEKKLIEFLEKAWKEPDSGIWESRGPLQHFTHSKVMAWVAFDRAIQAVEKFGLDGDTRSWKRIRAAIRAEVLRKGFDRSLGSFVQAYGSKNLDASLLMIPLVGFLPATDRRVRGTVQAIEKRLTRDGFVRRYSTEDTDDGLQGNEGSFIACTLWLADNYILQGRQRKAKIILDRVLAVRNDVGLLAEEYETREGRLVGNFPQAFSHVALINTIHNLVPRKKKLTPRRGERRRGF